MNLANRASILLGRAKNIWQEEGVVSLIKRAFLFLIGYQSCYVYEKDLNEPSNADFTPRIQDFTLKLISAPQQIGELVAEGFDFSSAPNIVNFNPERKVNEISVENFNVKARLDQGGGVLFCGFVDKALVHTNWIAMSKKANMDPYLIKVDWRNEATMGPSNTNPEYRGLGIKTHVRSQMYQFLKEKARAKGRGTFDKRNIAQHKSEAKLGSKIVGEGRRFKILFWRFCTVKPIKKAK